MAVINELIRVEEDGTISFGDYTLAEKAKRNDFEYQGAVYKVKTHKDVTRLECNDVFVYESVPGTVATHFQKEESKVSFEVEGAEDAQITLELEEGAEYEIIIKGESVGVMNTNLGGKLSFGVELEENTSVNVLIEKR